MCFTFTVVYLAFVLVAVVTITEGSLENSSLFYRLKRSVKSAVGALLRPLKAVGPKLLKPSFKIIRRKLSLTDIDQGNRVEEQNEENQETELELPVKYNVSRLIDRSSSVVLAEVRHNCSKAGTNCPFDREWEEIKEIITQVVIDHLQYEIHRRAIDWE